MAGASGRPFVHPAINPIPEFVNKIKTIILINNYDIIATLQRIVVLKHNEATVTFSNTFVTFKKGKTWSQFNVVVKLLLYVERGLPRTPSDTSG